MNPNYSILINTTDSFEDCWIPFFILFKKYWNDFSGTIYLNTETKKFSFDGLNILSVQNNQKTPNYNPTWSECLLSALEVIPDDIVLYMQEDYFIHDYVKNGLVNDFVKLIQDTDIGCIHLTDQATPGPFHKTRYKLLLEIDKNAPYRISTQAALWKRDVLKQYIRKLESAWQFESYGSRRARILRHKIYNVDISVYAVGKIEIIPYVFTGIIRGKWKIEIANVFSKHGIEIDLGIRGFYDCDVKRNIIEKIRHSLTKVNIKTILISGLDVFYLNIRSLKNGF